MTLPPDSRCATSHTSNMRWLLMMCVCQLLIMLVFINYSAVLPLLRQEWGMSNTRAGMIFSVYQLGYIASGVLLSVLTDRMNTRIIFITAAFWSAAANLLFALYAHDFTSAMILRALTGIGMGGTYMPGLKLVAERFDPSSRGRAIGIYVGSLVMGASLSLVVTGWLTGIAGWRHAFIICSIGVSAGALLSFWIFRDYTSPIHTRSVEGFSGEVLQNRSALLMILGYGAHMWEMYGMRSWLAPFLTSAMIGWGVESTRATGFAATAAAVMVGIGAFSTAITGSLSDRCGRTVTISIVMSASALLSFGFGWLINTNIWLTLAVGLVYGYLIVAESPVFSTGLTELVTPGYLGAAMGLQSLIGYSMGMISPTVFGWALDTFRGWQPWPGINGEWGVGFITLGLGALAGPVFMRMLKATPDSIKMANGRR